MANKLLDCRIMKLETYIEQTGGAAALAKELGVSPEAVRLWVRGERLPKPATAMRIERLTRGLVSKVDLRPDIFADDAKPTTQAAE